MFSLVATTFAIPFVVLSCIYLASDVTCDSGSTLAPGAALAAFGLLAVIGGITAGTWASFHRPRFVGLATIAFNLGLLFLGIELLRLDFGHSPVFCIG